MSTDLMDTIDSTQEQQYLDLFADLITEPLMTQTQHDFFDGQAQGQSLWEDALEQLQDFRVETAKQRTIPRKKLGFRFLDLPAELRNKIYDHCIKDDDQRHYDKCYCDMRNGSDRRRRASKKLTERQEKTKARMSRLVAEVDQTRRRGEISQQAYDAFCNRKWQNTQTECSASQTTHNRQTVIHLHASGDLCRKLPAICCVNAQTMQETWGLFFPSTTKFQVIVSEKDVFPCLRFFAMLKQIGVRNVTGKDVSLVADKQHTGREKGISLVIRKLIVFHWLNDLPLWHCFTGITVIGQAYSASKPFGKWMYSVRQIVALYHLDRKQWRDLALKCLLRCRSVDNQADEQLLSAQWDCERAEAVTDILIRAMECRLMHVGGFTDAKEYGDSDIPKTIPYRHWADQPVQPTCAKTSEYAILHFVNQFRIDVDERLRTLLGEGYKKWEEDEDKKTLPEDLVY